MDTTEGSQGAEGGFTDRPLPPWELPGNFRRDCEPHRAGLLRLLAALIVGAGGLCLLVSTAEFWPIPSAALLSLSALAGAAGVTALGIWVWTLARKDVALMRLGLMDPRGEGGTRRAGWLAALGALLAAASFLFTPLGALLAGIALATAPAFAWGWSRAAERSAGGARASGDGRVVSGAASESTPLLAAPRTSKTAVAAWGLGALSAASGLLTLVAAPGRLWASAGAFGLLALVAGVAAWRRVRRHPQRLRGKALAAWGIGLPLLGLLLLPRAAVICESAAQRQAVSRLEKLTRAMLAYADEHNSRLPPAVLRGRDGRRLHSWRVLLLPYLGHKGLYQQFNLDEPWDSPHNLALLPRMPEDYALPPWSPPGVQVEPGTTFYQVFVGEGTAFDGPQGLRLPADFPDGLWNTILIVEAGEAVPWTRPVDLAYARDRPVPALGGVFRGQGGFSLFRPNRLRRFHVGLADGSVVFVTPETTEKTLREAIVRDDGIAISDDW
jgi:hypothetical protein